MRFHGTYERSIDGKGRLILPAEVREQLSAAGGTGLVLSMSNDYSIALYTEADWQVKEDRLARNQNARTRPYMRLLMANTKRVVPDKQGRVALPTNLMRYASIDLEQARDVVVTGAFDHFLIWGASNWQAYNEQHEAGATLEAHDAIEFDASSTDEAV